MKYFTLCTLSFCLLFGTSQAQNRIETNSISINQQETDRHVDKNPTYRTVIDDYVIEKIDYRKDRMIVHFRFESDYGYEIVTLYSPKGIYPWALKDQNSDRQFNLLGVHNVHHNGELISKHLTETTTIKGSYESQKSMIVTCEVHFQRLPKEVKMVDLIEGLGYESYSNHFNCFDIKLKPYSEEETIHEVAERVPLIIEPLEIAPTEVAKMVVLEKEAILELLDESVLEEEIIIEALEEQETNFEIHQDVSAWTAYPNPTTTNVNIKRTSNQEAQIEVISLDGKILSQQTTQDYTTTLNLGQFPAGSYILRVKENNHSSSKIVVLK